MRNDEFLNMIEQTREKLEATDAQLAKHIRMNYKTYFRIKNGEITLTVVKRRRLIKRMEGLLERCGLK